MTVINSPLPDKEREIAGHALQATLVDLLDLSLVAKQAHWNLLASWRAGRRTSTARCSPPCCPSPPPGPCASPSRVLCRRGEMWRCGLLGEVGGEVVGELVDGGVDVVAPSGRFHYAITNGGGAPNVTPDMCSIWFFVREGGPARAKVLYDKIVECGKAAAQASQTRLVHNSIPPRGIC
jgi:hypothetical protein